jgi:quinol monooxygenase YgiN
MPETAVTVIAELIASPGREEETRQLLLSLMEPTRKEEGCIRYELHEAGERPGHFAFLENWASQTAFDRHLKTPHLLHALARFSELLEAAPRIWLGKRIA